MANAYKLKQQEDRKQAALKEARAVASKGNAIARMKAVRGYQNAMGVDQRTAERVIFPGRWD